MNLCDDDNFPDPEIGPHSQNVSAPFHVHQPEGNIDRFRRLQAELLARVSTERYLRQQAASVDFNRHMIDLFNEARRNK
jgi:hypothetical protein